MFKRSDSRSDSEGFYSQSALFVEPPQRRITMKTVPDDGNEYIHKTRIESSRIDFNFVAQNESISEPESKEVGKISKIQLRKVAIDFAFFSNKLKTLKEKLKRKFPQSEMIPIENELESCLFCLGSDKCLKIHSNASCLDVSPHLPLLRYIIHLNQDEIQKLLGYTFMWYKSLGMNEDIGRWVFGLLACTDKPLSKGMEGFLESYFDDLKLRLDVCDEKEYEVVRKLMSLMDNYFLLKAKQHDGEYLNKLQKLSRK